MVGEEEPPNLKRWRDFVEHHPRSVPVLVFLTALTPLPESLIYLPLGLARYSMGRRCFGRSWGNWE
ncbi:MAG: hypothetical protein Kow0069_14670 [Promethearchaeota archaeon]